MRATEIKLCLFTTYTVDEFEAKAQELSDATTKYTEVEDRKATTAKAFKEELDRIDYEKSTLAGQVKRKGEGRMIDCAVSMHEPTTGFKSIYRTDTGKFVKTEQMTRGEMQDCLFPIEPEPPAVAQEQGTVLEMASGATTETADSPEGPLEPKDGEIVQPAASDAEGAAAIEQAVGDAIAKDEDPRAQGVRKTFGRRAQGVQ